MIPVHLLALLPGPYSRCTCSTTEGIGAAGGIGGEEEEAIMAGRAEDGPYPWCGACRGPREERSGRARNLMMEWFYDTVERLILWLYTQLAGTDRLTPPIPAKLKKKNLKEKWNNFHVGTSNQSKRERSSMNESQRRQKWEASFNSFVKISAQLIIPGIWWTVISPWCTLSRMAFERRSMCFIPDVVVVLHQSMHPWLSL